MLIAITGFMGAGKTTVADHLVTRYGFVRVRFAEPLKRMVESLLKSQGCNAEYIKRCLEGDLKQKPVPEFLGQTPRHVMQTLGTEWGRNWIGQDLWVHAWNMAANNIGRRAPVVTDDCRFFNEHEAVKAMGGEVWRVVRPDRKSDGHQSEVEQMGFECDENLLNSGTIPQLCQKVDMVLRTRRRRVTAE